MQELFRNLVNVFVFDKIPANKLRNATRAYARTVGNDETIMVLYDDTVFGSSRDGFLLTTRRLYGKNIFESGFSAELADIVNLTFEGTETVLTAPKVHAHTRTGVLQKELTVSNSNGQAEALFQALQQAIALLNPNLASAFAPTMNPQQVPARCNSCGAGGQVAVCEYCGNAV